MVKMPDHPLKGARHSWDVMENYVGGSRGSNDPTIPDQLCWLSTNKLPELSNHDRIQSRKQLKVTESRMKEQKGCKTSNMVALELHQPKALPLHTSRIYDSIDEEFLSFPSYQDVKQEELPCSQQSPTISCDIIDDTFLQHRPTVHVDYLSHDWLEEDIWSSWKHIVSHSDAYSNGRRLTNACWRMWEKKRLSLKTVSPESIEWVKDCDVTWLYGPLHTSRIQSLDAAFLASKTRGSEIDLGLPKPILKTPSLSAMILQGSEALVSRQSSPALESISSRSSTPRRPLQRAKTFSLFPCQSKSSSTAEKNVRFHHEVEQCVSVVEAIPLALHNHVNVTCHFSSPLHQQVVFGTRKDSPRQSSPTGSLKTIVALPPTQLKPGAEPEVVPVQRANSWPKRSLSSYTWNEDNLPAPSVYNHVDEETDWISPIPREPAKSQLLDRIPMLTDEDLYEIQMFGSVQHQITIDRPSFTSPVEDPETHSSPSNSDSFSSSNTSDRDEDEYSLREETPKKDSSNSFFTPTYPLSSPRSYLLSSNDSDSSEDGDFPSFRNEMPTSPKFSYFNSKDHNTFASIPPSPQFHPSTTPNLNAQLPKTRASLYASQSYASTRDEDDEEHWWMNV